MTGKLRKKLDKFGFITNTQGDFFLLPSSMQKTPGVDFNDLNVGDTLEFEPIEGPKGWRAIECRRIATATVTVKGKHGRNN